MNPHHNPRQCLGNLEQRKSDGGRREFLEQERKFHGDAPEFPTGDCAIVALVHASFRPPNGQSYRDSLDEISWSIRPWMYDVRTKNEKTSSYFIRRIRQWIKPPEQNPIQMTPSHATALRLGLLGYQHIYPNDNNRWICICDMESTHVLDVQIPEDHTMTVHQKVVYTTAPFDPGQTEVGNVFRLSPKATKERKAWMEYHLAYDEWAENFVNGTSGSEALPKLEEYLRK